MLRNLRVLFAGTMLALSGTAAPAEPAESVRYKSWAAQKPGTAIIRSIENKSAAGVVRADVRQTLVEVTPHKVVLDVAVSISGQGRVVDIPRKRVEFPARTEPGADLMPQEVNGTWKPLADETLEIAEIKYDCKVIEFVGEQKTDDPKTPIKASGTIWYNDQIPGAVARIVQTSRVLAPDGSIAEATAITNIAKIEIRQQ